MVTSLHFDPSVPTRELVRLLRAPPVMPSAMPENVQWRAFLELKRRGEAGAATQFITAIKALHRRRTLGAAELVLADADPEEHRLAEDPYLGELWRSYKRCLLSNRPGPAAQILREMEQQLM